jgi:hypothetical protein
LRLHILVEGPSEEALLKTWFPRFLPQHTFRIIRHEGKGKLSARPSDRPIPRHTGLLDLLPATLRAYGRSLDPATDRVLVLLDLDRDSCLDLKQRLTLTLEACNPKPTVLFRFAIEETEAFYLGDQAAIRRAFPDARLKRMQHYIQDSICGTWEVFQQVIGANIEDKPGWARRMAPHLGTNWRGSTANRSMSTSCRYGICLNRLSHERDVERPMSDLPKPPCHDAEFRSSGHKTNRERPSPRYRALLRTEPASCTERLSSAAPLISWRNHVETGRDLYNALARLDDRQLRPAA